MIISASFVPQVSSHVKIVSLFNLLIVKVRVRPEEKDLAGNISWVGQCLV